MIANHYLTKCSLVWQKLDAKRLVMPAQRREWSIKKLEKQKWEWSAVLRMISCFENDQRIICFENDQLFWSLQFIWQKTGINPIQAFERSHFQVCIVTSSLMILILWLTSVIFTFFRSLDGINYFYFSHFCCHLV